jgi:hypothetical protein
MSRGPTYTEAHRNACEVAMLAALPAERRRAFFMGAGERPRTLEQIRGRDAAVELYRQVRQALGGAQLW